MLHKNAIKRTLLVLSIISSFLLTACNEVVETMSSEDYVLSEDGATSKGIKVGDPLETFFEAYENHAMLISYGDEQYAVFHKNDILTEEETFSTTTFSLLLPTFFIDDEACDTDLICETYQVTKENLLSFLNSEDFLKEHSVVYEFILFDFKDGVLSNILESSRDFNAELAYANK